jgi:integrase
LGGTLEEDLIPMTDDLYQALLFQKQNSPGIYVFNDPETCKPYNKRQHWLENLCKRAGVTRFGFHAIRRLTPSILASKNVPLPVIQLILRHRKISTTDRYVTNLTEVRSALKVLQGGKIFTSYVTSVEKEQNATK